MNNKSMIDLLNKYAKKEDNIENKIKIVEKYNNYKLTNKGLQFYLKKQLGIIEEFEFLKCKNYKLGKENEENRQKKISVIITTYNRKKMLVKAIESVLSQSYRNFEIIIIDDNSNDGTDKLVTDKYRNIENIIYSKTSKNQGPGINRLVGYRDLSSGDFIIFMDDDDFFIDDEYFKKAMDIYSKSYKISFVAANTLIYYENENKVKVTELGLPYKVNNKEYFLNFQTKEYPKPLSTFTAIFDRCVLERVNLSNMKMVNDSSIYLRTLLDSSPILLDDIVGVYRIHGNNITFSCTSNFILENIEEKLNIKKLAVQTYNYNEEEIEQWFHRMLDITIYYYFINSPTTGKDYSEIANWLKENDKCYYNKNKFKLMLITGKKNLKKFLKKILKS